MTIAVAQKGYAISSIADVVRHARVSKRTFYEHFADKQECFLASYEAASERLLERMRAAAESGDTWRSSTEAATAAYLGALAEQPAITRTFFIEIQAAGADALALRRRVNRDFANFMRELAHEARKSEPTLPELDPTLAMAMVGGINELVLLAIERGNIQRLPEIAERAAAVLRAVMTAVEETRI